MRSWRRRLRLGSAEDAGENTLCACVSVRVRVCVHQKHCVRVFVCALQQGKQLPFSHIQNQKKTQKKENATHAKRNSVYRYCWRIEFIFLGAL